jgi:hypothetical protein
VFDLRLVGCKGVKAERVKEAVNVRKQTTKDRPGGGVGGNVIKLRKNPIQNNLLERYFMPNFIGGHHELCKNRPK